MKIYWKIPFPLRVGLLVGLAMYGTSVALRYLEVSNEFIRVLAHGVGSGLGVYASYYLEGRRRANVPKLRRFRPDMPSLPVLRAGEKKIAIRANRRQNWWRT
jgi:hypothetical protein